jgi:hypothetical protein
MLQAEGLLKHCLEAFGGGLTVHTAIEHLVWAHKDGPEEARGLAMTYVVRHIKAIQVTDLLLTVMLLCGARSSLPDWELAEGSTRECGPAQDATRGCVGGILRLEDMFLAIMSTPPENKRQRKNLSLRA